jgi:hypothetical protein
MSQKDLLSGGSIQIRGIPTPKSNVKERTSKIFNLQGMDELITNTFNIELDDIITMEEYDSDLEDLITEQVKIQYPNYKSQIEKGDIISIIKNGYRNDGKYIWNGKSVESLNYFFDEYGGVPPTYQYPEFPLDTWDNVIDHNKIRWIRPDKMEEIKNLYRVVPDIPEYRKNWDWNKHWETAIKENGKWNRYLIM